MLPIKNGISMVNSKQNNSFYEDKHLKIRDANLSDIDFIVDCHMTTLSDDVFPAFGDGFLKKFYHAAHLQKSSALIVAQNGSQIAGFVLVATIKNSALSYLTANSAINFAFSALSRPALFTSAIQQYSRKNLFPNKNTAEITFIAVNKNAQSNGIGSKLIDAAGKFALSQNIEFLSTKTANEPLAKYYENTLAAETLDRFNAAGRRYHILRWSIN